MIAVPVFSRTELAHLAACREAWEHAIYAQGHDGASLQARLDRLRELTGDPEVNVKVSLAEHALRHYPMPHTTDARAYQSMWRQFHFLVLAVQVQDEAWAERVSRFLEDLVTGISDIDAEWWLARAEAYAPLGLTIGTCV